MYRQTAAACVSQELRTINEYQKQSFCWSGSRPPLQYVESTLARLLMLMDSRYTQYVSLPVCHSAILFPSSGLCCLSVGLRGFQLWPLSKYRLTALHVYCNMCFCCHCAECNRACVFFFFCQCCIWTVTIFILWIIVPSEHGYELMFSLHYAWQ